MKCLEFQNIVEKAAMADIIPKSSLYRPSWGYLLKKEQKVVKSATSVIGFIAALAPGNQPDLI